jgi:hypothetical protein
MIKIEFPKNAFATMHPSAGGSAGGLFYIVEIEMHDDFEWSRPGMTIRTGAELQAAHRAAAERLQAIAMRYVPEGYTVEYRKSLSGRHYGQRKLIQAPRPVTRRSLYIFLHECAHAHLHRGRKPKAHVREMEAEKWAHEKMREHGVAVPRDMTKRAREYVARKIEQARRSGARRIDRSAARYARAGD